MLIKCIKSFRNQLKVGNVYLVVEISIKAANNSVGFRVIDDEGYPAIYEADRFEIVSNRIDDFAILINEDHIVPVSYTHLDVYKRQAKRRRLLRI